MKGRMGRCFVILCGVIGLIFIGLGLFMIILGIHPCLTWFMILAIIGTCLVFLSLVLILKDRNEFKLFIKIFIVMIITMLTVLSMFHFWYSGINVAYEYSIEIIPSNEDRFTLFVPIPLTRDGEVSRIIDNLHIEIGNVAYTVIETEHGKALNITAKGNIRITSNGRSGTSIFSLLSMDNNSRMNRPTEFWVYANLSETMTNVELKIECKERGPQFYKNCYLSGSIKNGWQMIEGEQKSIVT